VDLVEVCRGCGPTPSLVVALIENLTADSAFHASSAAAETGSTFTEWRRWQSTVHSALLAAEQIDFVREGTAAHVGKKYKLKPHPRPGEKKRARVLTVADINRMADGPPPAA